MNIKKQILGNLKAWWKIATREQYKKEPDKVRNANIDKSTDNIMSNPVVKMTLKKVGITKEDIKRILTEIRNEVCNDK